MAVRQVKKEKWTKDGRKWQFIVYYKNFEGKRKQKFSQLYFTKKEAEEAERLFLMKRDNPLHKNFSLVAKDYIENLYLCRKDATAYSYEGYYNNHIRDFFKAFYIDEINIINLKAWKDYMIKKNLKIRTLNKAYTLLNNIFKYSMQNFGLSTNYVSVLGPFQEKKEEVIEDEKKLRYITYPQFTQFISTIDDTFWKTFFIFLYYTGMRKGEVQALAWKDIDFNNNYISVTKTLSVKSKSEKKMWKIPALGKKDKNMLISDIEYLAKYKITSTKNNQNRKITMNNILKQQLITYKNIMTKYSDFSENWFVFGGPRFLPQTTIDRKKNYYFHLIEIDDPITIHEFRHSHVSLLINEYVKASREKNMKIDTAKFFLMMSNRMGHTVEVMQKTYMHLFPTVQDEIVDLLDNLI